MEQVMWSDGAPAPHTRAGAHRATPGVPVAAYMLLAALVVGAGVELTLIFYARSLWAFPAGLVELVTFAVFLVVASPAAGDPGAPLPETPGVGLAIYPVAADTRPIPRGPR
jgi:hypothetical protein